MRDRGTDDCCVSLGLFLAIPFGMVADKYGRKWLLVINIIQMQVRACWVYLICERDPSPVSWVSLAPPALLGNLRSEIGC